MPYIRITLNDIAKRVGVDRSTVSRALRGSQRVKSATRKEICSVAQEMGYRPDPGLSSLVSMRKRTNRSRERGYTIAVVTNDHVDNHRGDHFFRALESEAETLGYHLVEFPYHLHPDPTQLERILISRGTSGILVAQNLDRLNPPTLPCDRIPTVWLDCSIPDCPSPIVMTNGFRTVEIAWTRLRKAGHKRIGFMHDRLYVEGDRMRVGAYRHMRAMDGRLRHPPMLHVGVNESRETAIPVIRKWLEETGVTAVIAHFGKWYCWILEAGFRIPEDVAFVAMVQQVPDSRICGFADPVVNTSCVALRHLDQMIRLQSPELYTTNHWILVSPDWIPGESFPESDQTFVCNLPDVPSEIWRDNTPWPFPPPDDPWTLPLSLPRQPDALPSPSVSKPVPIMME